MDIADDVERATLMFKIVPQRLADDLRGVNLIGRMQHMHSAKTFPFKIAQRSAQLLRLLAHDMGTESTLRAITVPAPSATFHAFGRRKL